MRCYELLILLVPYLDLSSETLPVFIEFKSMPENPWIKGIKILQCEGGGEYKYFQKLAKDSGFQLWMSCPFTSAQKCKDQEKT